MGQMSIHCPHSMNGRIQAEAQYLGNSELSLQAELGRKAELCALCTTPQIPQMQPRSSYLWPGKPQNSADNKL